MANLELFQKPKSIETESIVKTNTDLRTGQFASLAGIKGKQFGKDIFSAVLKFKDLRNFLRIFEEVQRSVSPRKVNKIKAYIMSGIENTSLMRFFSAMTVTVRSNVFYDDTNKQLAIDTNASKLSINDGQHRHYAIASAIDEYKKRMSKAKDAETFERYKKYVEELEDMVIPLVIFSGITEAEEKQLFHDLNNLAQRPSRNATIKLSQTDTVARIARELAASNEYLIKYGVEFNKNSIHPNNPNFILLTSIHVFIRNLFLSEIKENNDYINDSNYEEILNYVNNVFNKIFEALPKDLHVKGKYILNRNFTFRGIAAFLHDVEGKGENELAYEAISRVNWKTDINYWVRYDASLSETGNLLFPSNGEGGVKSVKKACLDIYRRLQ